AAVYITVGITLEEEDATEMFSGNEMPKNGSLFMCAISKSLFSSSIADDACGSTIVEEAEPVNAAGFGATTLAIRVITLGADKSTLGGGISNSSNSG
nr:hypothetical protein [Tanacetum cinerariifolium]